MLIMLGSEELARLARALGGLPVLGCRPGSPAARSGIRYGDIVMAVNGVPTPDWGAYIAARGRRIGAMTVSIFRAGVEFEVETILDNVDVDPRALLAELISENLPRLPTGDDHNNTKPS
jgi:S1-C subfamily serine protease